MAVWRNGTIQSRELMADLGAEEVIKNHMWVKERAMAQARANANAVEMLAVMAVVLEDLELQVVLVVSVPTRTPLVS